ncbi:TRAP transporter small permease [Natrialbaceae archaeon AArc-T1-2]|uniref:TRAP transporter small permease n=1 Tax=Natrialbaceae archaeon AArc-T1-2 TaxID=3053904 RepID=UPI00255A893E|nr:TRAP transporter small permease subunit [Natrialbaceae archaeon AArc-T1-2]WIV67898.1 TRAP transporter small permease subunit [Natrialbaceae archaeon AArc-T1-2]
MDTRTLEIGGTQIEFKDAVRRATAHLEGLLALAILAVYTTIITLDVIQRTLWGGSFTWSLDIVLGLFTWMTWLSAAFAVRHRSHLRFTLVRKQLSNRANYVMYWLEYVAWIVVMGLVLRFSVPIFLDRWETGRIVVGTGFVPSALLYLSVPVGMGLIVLRATEQIVRVRNAYRRGEDVTPTASIGTGGEIDD